VFSEYGNLLCSRKINREQLLKRVLQFGSFYNQLPCLSQAETIGYEMSARYLERTDSPNCTGSMDWKHCCESVIPSTVIIESQ
jgi:hypothetical protein